MKKLALSVLVALLVLLCGAVAIADEDYQWTSCGSTKAEATAIAVDQLYAGEVAANMESWLKFTTPAKKGFIRFYVKNLSATGYDVFPYLFSQIDEKIVEWWGVGRTGMAVGQQLDFSRQLRPGTTYYIAIQNKGEVTGNFMAGVYFREDEVGDSFSESKDIKLDTKYVSSMDGAGDRDVYKFVSGDAGTYTLEYKNVNIGESLYGIICNELDENLIEPTAGYETLKTETVELEANTVYYVWIHVKGHAWKEGNYYFTIKSPVTVTPTPVLTPTPTLTPTPAGTATPAPTVTVIPVESPTPTFTPAATFTPIPTEKATPVPTVTVVPEVTTSPAPVPTKTPEADPEDPDEPEEVTSNGGVYLLYEKDGTAVFTGPSSDMVRNLTIRKTIHWKGKNYNVIAIDEEACSDLSYLTTVTIGDHVRTIGKNAFAGCRKLKTVKGGKSVVTINFGAFANCKVLSTFPVMSRLQTIGDNAFKSCLKLTKFTLGASVKKIGKNAFNGCKALKNIVVKTTKLTASSVGASAFKGIHRKAVFNCTKAKRSSYKKIFIKRGAPSTCTFK